MKQNIFSTGVAFGRRYKLFSISLFAALVGLALDLFGLRGASQIVLIITSLLLTVPLIRGMWEDVRSGTYGIDILALTAIITAVLLQEYWAALVVVLMLTGGESLEDYAEHRARNELDTLLTKAPQMAHVLRGRKTVDVPVAEVLVGDKILIKTGEIVPVDAIILEGTGNFDEASLTGESIPEQKKPGDTIPSGSISMDAAITARAVHVAADSQYQTIVKLVQAAQNSQAPFVRLADRYAIPFTLFAFALAGGVWAYSGDPIRFLQVIIVATPCPLILAAPIAIISGMSRSSRRGIIVRTGSALERLAEVKTIAFDKTGTLTNGQPTIDRVLTYGDYSEQDIIGMAAALESASSHVLAKAINEAALSGNIRIPKARGISETPGHGLEAVVGGKRILVGRFSLLEKAGVQLPKDFDAEQFKQTVTYVAIGDELAGIILVEDKVRPDSKETIERLRNMGIQNVLMVTGDHGPVAASVSKDVGITDYHAEAMPADKLRIIDALRMRPVAFVGDGVNDAPVLAASDVGIALGARGSTAASESADIVILMDDLEHVASSVEIAKRTFRIAKQSIFIGIGLSVMLMLIFATGRFSPIYGALAQELVDVVVIFNALRAHHGGRR